MKRNKYLIFTILWMAVIFYFSSQNGDTSSMNDSFVIDLFNRMGIDIIKLLPGVDIHFVVRKCAHLTEYFILGVLLYKTYKSYSFKYYHLYAIITGFLYACSDEYHQSFSPGRGPAFRDVLIDTAGVALGVMLLYLLHLRKREGSRAAGRDTVKQA